MDQELFDLWVETLEETQIKHFNDYYYKVTKISDAGYHDEYNRLWEFLKTKKLPSSVRQSWLAALGDLAPPDAAHPEVHHSLAHPQELLRHVQAQGITHPAYVGPITEDPKSDEWAKMLLRQMDNVIAISRRIRRADESDTYTDSDELALYNQHMLMAIALETLYKQPGTIFNKDSSGHNFHLLATDARRHYLARGAIMNYAAAQHFEGYSSDPLHVVDIDDVKNDITPETPVNVDAKGPGLLTENAAVDDVMRRRIYGLIEAELREQFGLVFTHGRATYDLRPLDVEDDNPNSPESIQTDVLKGRWRQACSNSAKMAYLCDIHNVLLWVEARQSREIKQAEKTGNPIWSYEPDHVAMKNADALRWQMTNGRSRRWATEDKLTTIDSFMDALVDYTLSARDHADKQRLTLIPTRASRRQAEILTSVRDYVSNRRKADEAHYRNVTKEPGYRTV